MKITVFYDPVTGHSQRDGDVEQWVTDIIDTAEGIDEDDLVVTVSNALAVDYFRLNVLRGVLRPEELEFRFGNIRIAVDRSGRLNHWPEGFCDHRDKLLEELIGWSTVKYKDTKPDGQE